MVFSLQSFPPNVASFLTKTLDEEEHQSRRASLCANRPNNGSNILLRNFSSCVLFVTHTLLS